MPESADFAPLGLPRSAVSGATLGSVRGPSAMISVAGRKASLALIVVLALLWAPPTAFGEDATLSKEPTGVEPVPPVGLDQLLRLPDSYSLGGAGKADTEVAGSNAPEWRERFAEADARVDQAKAQLAKAQKTLASNASDSSQWNLSAPGVKATTTKDSTTGLPLRQQIRRSREEVEAAERDKRALEVEADLAGVPAQWRE